MPKYDFDEHVTHVLSPSGVETSGSWIRFKINSVPAK